MISSDQDDVARRAREATPSEDFDPCDFCLSLEPVSVDETGAYCFCQKCRALPSLDTMDVRDLHKAKNAYPEPATPASRERYHALALKQSELSDEIAGARFLARSGRPPEKHWKDPRVTHDSLCAKRMGTGVNCTCVMLVEPDPRAVAWEETHWRRFCASAIKLPDYETAMPGVDQVRRIALALRDALASLNAIVDYEERHS